MDMLISVDWDLDKYQNIEPETIANTLISPQL